MGQAPLFIICVRIQDKKGKGEVRKSKKTEKNPKKSGLLYAHRNEHTAISLRQNVTVEK